MANKSTETASKANPSPKMQELFLPVHGHVSLYPEEVAVIDHPSFQRLRRVRQLGLAHAVFPGGVHTRLEHSIGAVHVAQAMVRHVNENYGASQPDTSSGDWRITEIDINTAKLVRLGALLHDIGHLPFGHTLEDELNHLPSHDGLERVGKIAEKKYAHYDLDRSVNTTVKPLGGWSLKELVNVLYGQVTRSLRINLDPFSVLCAIVCKPPKQQGAAKDSWEKIAKELEARINLQMCRDIVGNTICADFLDYLFRDWHHLGKTLYEDKRLYQYMEARTKTGADGHQVSRFVINVGSADRVRHDALTNILELLEDRYKLAETVLFHRTKLAITALLDRCLLEIRALYQDVGIPIEDFSDAAEQLFLEGSDDALPDILLKLAAGGNKANSKKLNEVIKASRKAIGEEVKPNLAGPDLLDAATGAKTEIERQIDNIELLVDRLKDRCVYTLAYKLRISDFTGAHNPEHPRLNKLIDLYRIPDNRERFLRGMEARCNLPSGSLVMYCPPNAAMNAKVAKVNLLIEGEVTPFDDYDKGGDDSNLTRGALWAQIRRFYELWSAQVYVDRVTWDALSLNGRMNLRATLKEFFFQMRPDTDVSIVREQVEASVLAVLAERPLAARGESASPELDKYSEFTFPSGLKFACAQKVK